MTAKARTRTADTAPKTLPRDLDQSDVDADAARMADAAAVAPKARRTRTAKAAETPAEPGAAAPEARTPKASTQAADAQPQPPAPPAESPIGDKPAPAPRLSQADMVLAFLAAHPDEDFGPQAVSKAITPEGRKPLGVRDCLARLAKAGKVTITSEKPLRYKAAAA